MDVLLQLKTAMINDIPNPPQLRIYEGINVNVSNSYRLLKTIFLEDMQTVYLYHQSASQGSQRWLMKKAISYIEGHFSDELKATEVADAINVSPNYFSQLFKQETGKHFNDYLHEVRINRAKQLLHDTTYRVFEIAELVGYRDYKYFVQIFKKYTALTPTNFRNLMVQR